MIKSMTGFGFSEYEDENYKIKVEIKSLNSKIFDFRVKCPNITAQNEMEIRNFLSSSLIRGKIDCNIDIEIKNNAGKYIINEKVFDKYYQQLICLNEKYNTKISNFDFYKTIIQLPETLDNQEIGTDTIWAFVSKTVQNAAKQLDVFRVQEGNATKKVFTNCLKYIDNYLSHVVNFESLRIETIRNKIVSAFDESKINIDENRFESELIFYLEKYDISEEKSRLANHLAYFVKTLEDENSGKKLSFIVQEMGREINTLGSKANNFEIQRLVVSMKDELEKIKEQLLNIL